MLLTLKLAVAVVQTLNAGFRSSLKYCCTRLLRFLVDEISIFSDDGTSVFLSVLCF